LAENYEYESILQQMLDMQPTDVDKREGSIIYNTCAASAFIIAQQTYMIGYLFNLLFADTAEDEWLDRVCADFGVTREAATYSIRQINTFDSQGAAMDCTIGDRFAINDLTFALTTKIATGQYQATCEQLGAQGNAYSGTILPVDNINGLGSATLVSTPLVPATDAESDDTLRTRFYAYVQQSPYGGNIADYEQKTLAISGVGAVKVFNATTMGAGNVGVVIGDDNGNKATQTLIDTVQNLMGVDGSGIAPIGHTVTVGTSTDLTVNVAAGIKIKSGASFSTVQTIVTQTITDYINNIGFNDSTVFYAKLVSAILNCSDSITDVGTVTINGASTNLSLTKTFANYQVPVLGTVTVTNAT
jgi:uncharacterized phage protein gp47/JayE